VSPDNLTRLQTAGLSLAERALSRSADVVLNASEALVPEQRKELAVAWRQWR
jgi:hypothetical protein